MDTEAVAHIYNGIWLSHNKEWIWVSSSDVDEPRASNTEWSELKWKSVICVQLFTTPWTVARQFPLSMGFSRQDYCSELPFLPSDDLPDPGTEPRSSALQAGSLPSEPSGEAKKTSKYQWFNAMKVISYSDFISGFPWWVLQTQKHLL